jgi:hypothetical protein
MVPDQMEALKTEIRERGFDKSKRLLVRVCNCDLITGQHYEIVDGEQKFTAGVAEGMDVFPSTWIDCPEFSEASFRTFVSNNIRGEINEIKLAILVDNWRKKGVDPELIYSRTGVRQYKQEALLNQLKPKTISEDVFKSTASKSQHRSFAVIVTNEESEILHRALKLTRLRGEADQIMAIAEFYLKKHELTNEQRVTLTRVINELSTDNDARDLVALAEYYLSHVKKEEIRQ